MGWVHLSVLHLKKKNHISSRHELMCSVRTKRSEASHVPGVLTSLIQPECECVQVIVFNCGDDLMVFFFSVIYPPLELHTLTPYTARQCLSDKWHFMPEPLCNQPFCVPKANSPPTPNSAALLWSGIVLWPLLFLQGAHGPIPISTL